MTGTDIRPMKIFWFTNIVVPELAQALGRKPEVVGGWISSLLDVMRPCADVEFAVATIDPGVERLATRVVQGVTYFRLPVVATRGLLPSSAFLAQCAEAVEAFKPDIIHVHGTEEVYGLFTSGTTSCPAVISVQGLIHVYSRHVRGGLSLGDYRDAGRHGLLACLRFLMQEIQWVKRGRVERNIIAGNGYFIGRTLWDKSHVLAVNPAARYYHCDEILRPPFFASRWDIGKINRHTIFCTAAHSPLKGFHWLLYAVAQLRGEFPDINVRVAGAPWDEANGRGYYGRYIKKLIDTYGLSGCVTSLPALSAEDVARELQSAHAFVIPSLVENSPNSLAEAMLVGTPSVAAFVGGIASMVKDGESALCFPSGDAACLAHGIRRIFTDDPLAENLSREARSVASARHDPKRIGLRQMEIYRQVIADAPGSHA